LTFQERVALGSRGFRQGIHYWKITIQSYDNNSDPAFGIARFDVSKQHMLGTIHSSSLFFISFSFFR
jgi:tripartite motif-containing protein 9/67